MADKVKLEYKENSGDFRPLKAGTYPAVVVDAIDMGFRVRQFQDDEPTVQPFIAIVWASGEKQDNGDLVTASRYYKSSMHKKAALRQALEAMRGKKYSEIEAKKAAMDPDLLRKLVGHPCLITVEHKQSQDGERTYGDVTNIMALPEGMPKPTVTGYVRGEYWEKRKARFADEVAKFGVSHNKAEPEYPVDYDESPGEDDSESLPF
jgi:hypothetical protein